VVLFAVSAAADSRFKAIANIAAVGLLLSGLPLYWFTKEMSIREFPWVTPTKMALACIAAWLAIAIVLPLSGVLLRAFVSRWGEGINPFDTLTLAHGRHAEKPVPPAAVGDTVARSRRPSCLP
jgi:hypothetical protein